MYDSFSFTDFLTGILGIIMIVTFFVIAFRLKRIMNAIEGLAELEFRKPENRKTFKCEKCGKDFDISIAKKDLVINIPEQVGNRLVDCPHCKAFIRI